MARLFEDGFDHYGLTETNMNDGVYATVESSNGRCTLSTEQVATGTHSVKFVGTYDGDTTPLRKVLPVATDKLGITGRFYFQNLPTSNTGSVIAEFFTATAARGHLAATVDSNGAIRFYRGNRYDFTGDDGTLVATSDPILVPSAWNHVEIQVYLHDTDGWVRVAVNGVHRYQATGLDTKFNTDSCFGVGQGNRDSGGPAFFMDDYIIYDFTGDPATDTDFCPTYDGGTGIATGYIGELQVMWLQPNADTLEDDWVPSTGSDSYAMVDEADPNDADYIESGTVGDLTEFDMADLPEEITYIRGLTVWGRLSKSDAGAAFIKLGMKSVAATTDAPERPLTVEPTYWWDQINEDPDTGTRWTRDSFNDAWMRLTRSV